MNTDYNKLKLELLQPEGLKGSLQYDLINEALKDFGTGVMDKLEKEVELRVKNAGYTFDDFREFCRNRVTVVEYRNVKDLYVDFETKSEMYICTWFFEYLTKHDGLERSCNLTMTIHITK